MLREISSFNLDIPEGGFDALVQVMACKDVCLSHPKSSLAWHNVTWFPLSRQIIGWREGARHVVLFLTDAGVHLAYDGKVLWCVSV